MSHYCPFVQLAVCPVWLSLATCILAFVCGMGTWKIARSIINFAYFAFFFFFFYVSHDINLFLANFLKDFHVVKVQGYTNTSVFSSDKSCNTVERSL